MQAFPEFKWCYLMTCFTIVKFISVIGPLAIVTVYFVLYVDGLFNNMPFIAESCICLNIPVLYFFLVAHTVYAMVHKLPLNVFYGADLELSKLFVSMVI